MQREIIVDNFAGGGGASTGIERALGVPVDVAVNHNPEALAMHLANHPQTKHFCQNICALDPREATQGRPVGLAWFSPDCKHFSKAKGGAPVEKRIRDLAWVVVHWAQMVRPRVICLENVEEFQDWGPLLADGRPCPESRGLEFRRWVRELRKAGYAVEWKELRACDYGAPTIRKRLFLIARRDGRPIVWPAPTHGPGLLPYRTAAECIDWSIPCPSIFERKKPLAEATMRRIARGVKRYVLDNARPFIVPVTHHGADRCNSIDEPIRTVTGAHRGELALVAPSLMVNTSGHSGSDMLSPIPTITTGGHHALVAAFLAQHNGGATGHEATEPLSTITQAGTQQQLVTSHLLKLRNNCDGQACDEALHTVCLGGHFGEVRAFLMAYYGTDQAPQLDNPLPTCTSHDRFGLVTIQGVDYQIVDIGMRMLSPRELFRAQGFPDSYVIDPQHNGKSLSKTAQTRCCGNSVCPPVAEAIVRANVVMDESFAVPSRTSRTRRAVGQGMLL